MAGLPDYTRPNQRIRKRPANPFDRTTIISIFPREINEHKPTIDPGNFKIAAAKRDDFSILVVGPSSWYREVDHSQPLLEVINSSVEVANSVVRDYCNGILGCDMGQSMPGLFWLPGNFTKESIKTYNGIGYYSVNVEMPFSDHLKEARKRQSTWYRTLVRMADSLWANSNGNPSSISEDMRIAAKELSLDKPWLTVTRDMAKSPCKACGTLVDPHFPVCPNCKFVIDPEKAKALDLKFAVG